MLELATIYNNVSPGKCSVDLRKTGYVFVFWFNSRYWSLVSLDFFFFFSGNLLLGGWVLVESMGMIA